MRRGSGNVGKVEQVGAEEFILAMAFDNNLDQTSCVSGCCKVKNMI